MTRIVGFALLLLLALPAPESAADEPYIDYVMRRVSEGLAARGARHVADRLEGADLVALYAGNLKREKAPEWFITEALNQAATWLEMETDPWIRACLVEALADLDGDQRRQHLDALLADPDPTVRARAAEYLPEALSPAEERALLEGLGTETVWWVRKQLVFALAGGRTDESLVLLHRSLHHPSRDVRAAASEALRSRPDPRNLEPLIEALDQAGLVGEESPVWALGDLGEPAAAEAVIRQAESPYAPVRRGAAWALGKLGDARGVSVLGRLIEDADGMVQQAAAEALAALHGSAAARALIGYLAAAPSEKRLVTALGTNRDELVRACEDMGLKDIPLREACDLLKEHIKDRPATFWSSGDLHSVFYSPFNAKAREVAPRKGRSAIGWEDFIGKSNGGTKQRIPAGTRVTIWKAAEHAGETWLEVAEGPYSDHFWVRECDLKEILPETLRQEGLHTDYGGYSEMVIRSR